MGTCKDCKFWGVNRQGVCDRTDWANDGSSSFEVFADAADDTGLKSWLITGPDFGCIKFQNKETNHDQDT